MQVWVLGLQEAAHTGNGAAGAYASNEGVNLALCVFPNLRAGGFLVNLRVRLVSELCSQDGVIGLGDNFIRLVDGALHSRRTRG